MLLLELAVYLGICPPSQTPRYENKRNLAQRLAHAPIIKDRHTMLRNKKSLTRIITDVSLDEHPLNLSPNSAEFTAEPATAARCPTGHAKLRSSSHIAPPTYTRPLPLRLPLQATLGHEMD